MLDRRRVISQSRGRLHAKDVVLDAIGRREFLDVVEVLVLKQVAGIFGFARKE